MLEELQQTLREILGEFRLRSADRCMVLWTNIQLVCQHFHVSFAIVYSLLSIIYADVKE